MLAAWVNVDFGAGAWLHAVVPMALLTAVLVAAAVSDWRTGYVRNALTYPAVAAGLAWAALAGWVAGGAGAAGMEVTASLAAAGAALLPFMLIYMMGGLGGGDVKLMAAVGAISGDWRIVLATAVYAFVIAAVMAVGLMIREGLVRQTARRLVTAGLLTASRARMAPGWHAEGEGVGGGEVEREAVGVPFAVAIAIGGCVAGLELLLGVWTPWAGFVG